MTDLSITAANVRASAGARPRQGVAGATITAGQVLYLDSTDNRLKLADCDASIATSMAVGIALHGASAGQPLLYVEEDDDFTPGATLTEGVIYILSGTAGGIAPAADLAGGDYLTTIMNPKSATKAKLKINASGAALAV